MAIKKQSKSIFINFLDDYGKLSILAIQRAREIGKPDERRVLDIYENMVSVQMKNLKEDFISLFEGKERLLLEADELTAKLGAPEFMVGSIDFMTPKVSRGGIFKNIKDFVGGALKGIIEIICEILKEILDCLPINIPGPIKCLIDLICKLPGLIGKIFP